MFQGTQKLIKTFLMVFFLFFSLFYLHATDISTHHQAKTIRVSYNLLSVSQDNDGNSIKTEYEYSLLQKLRLYTGWKYEYVGDNGDTSMENKLTLLQEGKIDLIAGVSKTPEREKIFNYSNQSVANKFTIITVKEGNYHFSTEDYTQWNNIIVGCLTDSPFIQSFDTYAQMHHFSYTLKYYSSQQALSEALQNDQINCTLSSNLKTLHNEWIIDKLHGEPLFIVTKKENKALAQELDQGLDQLFKTEPKLKSDLHTQYYDNTPMQVYFTREEQTFIETCQKEGIVFSAIINPDMKPYSYLNEGKMIGSNVDICQLIFKKAGLQFAISDISTPEEYIHLVDSKTQDVILDFMFDYSHAESYGYYECNPYYSDSISSIHLKKKQINDIKTIAIPNTLKSFKQYFYRIKKRDASLVICKDTQECIDFIKKGTVDSAYLFTNSAQKILEGDSTNSFVISKIPESNVGFSIGINENQNNILATILEKCTASIHSYDMRSITTPYLVEPATSFSFIAFLYSNPITILIIILFLLLTGALIFYLTVTTKKNKQTRELNEQLQLALHSSAIANKAKSNFLARMSHEIRTPMNAIIGFTEIAQDETTTKEEIKDYLDKIEISSKILLSLINDILDMSAIENEKMKIGKSNFDFKDVINNITTIFTKQAKKKGVNFSVQINQIHHEFLIGDELRSNQILINLLSNSIKFTPPSHSVTLTITEGEEQQGLIPIQFIVKDTGCGMSENMRERLFQPFEQEDASTAHKYGGSGLGLSIAKNLITLMKGSIEVESKVQKGTTFTVTIPYEISVLPEQSILFKKYNFSNLHTIIIDQERDSYPFLESLLKNYRMNYDYTLLTDMALAQMKKAKEDMNPYTLCFIGCIQSEMSRIVFIHKIRELFGSTITIVTIEEQNSNTKEDIANQDKDTLSLTEPIFQSTLLDLLMKTTMPQKREQANKTVHSSYDFTGKHILLAEDVDLNREVAKKLLERVHLDVDTAINGQEAVDAYLQSLSHYYDCILLDINMPIMNGYEASKAIRLSLKPDAQTIPIYAMTANAFAEDIAAAMNAGMNGHIAKPIQTTILYKTLEKAFLTQDGSKHKKEEEKKHPFVQK